MKDIHNLLNKYESFLAKAQELAKSRNSGIDLCGDKHEPELYTKLFFHSNQVKNTKGKDRFTEAEISKLKMLIKERCNTPSNQQKAIRDKMRAIGFYGRDDFGIVDMTIKKFEDLIENNQITIIDAEKNLKDAIDPKE